MKKTRTKSGLSEVVYVSTQSLIPYGKNPRFNDIAVNEVAKSISEFGFKQPIVVDANNVIIIGHTRYKAAMFLGLETVPVIFATDLTEKQIKALRIADNKLGELSTWDFGKLGVEMQGFSDLEYAAKNTGFSKDFIQSVMPDAGNLVKDPANAGESAALVFSRITFRDEEQKEYFMQMLFALRKRYTECETAAQRFLAFIKEFGE